MGGGAHDRRILPLDAEKEHPPMPTLHRLGQGLQMLEPPCGHCIGEIGGVALGQGDAFHLHIAGAFPLQEEIQAAPFKGDLGAGQAQALEPFDDPFFQGLPEEGVGPSRVDAHQGVGELGELPAVGVFAPAAVGVGQPYPGAGLGEAEHGAGVGAVGGDGRPAQVHLGQEALVAPDEGARREGGKPHILAASSLALPM